MLESQLRQLPIRAGFLAAHSTSQGIGSLYMVPTARRVILTELTGHCRQRIPSSRPPTAYGPIEGT
ncbi:hypothetical protein VFPFJ_10345 [Purpureocillium lilacinum]|uniref:Uncharacterized protein n=1 Tax=Purpureocillium lilacinum TaxID=33203 RepID=A0A179GKE9_PURLI|nr:hypothetical protein VFPFJ_10345 [Purpureocillium lilacinum]OAQ77978.1 hypothetical protein VFPFJ_10345 [Purpureocillium lilacinum]